MIPQAELWKSIPKFMKFDRWKPTLESAEFTRHHADLRTTPER
jgi:hypothetical protein